METEQKFVVWAVLVLMLLSLLSLGGCDYWPPALQAEIEQLRAHLNDALDEQAKLYEELEALKAKSAPGHRKAESEGLELSPMPPSLGASALSTELPPAADLVLDAQEQPPHRTVPSKAKVAKGAPFHLQLREPYQTGTQVVTLQRLLRKHAMPIRVDGVYGPETAAAVRSFQRVHRLAADGIAGPATYTALRRKPPLVRLARRVWLQQPPVAGVDVLAIQHALRRSGHRVAADGRYGPETVAAIRRFQRRHGLTPDGVIGPETWRALTGRQKAR